MVVKHLITRYLHNLQVTCKVCRSCRSFAGIMDRIPRNICILHGFAYWFIVYTINMHTYAYYFLNQIMCKYKLVNYICIGQATFERCDLSKSYRNHSPKNEPSPSGHPRCRFVFLIYFFIGKIRHNNTCLPPMDPLQ